jgi:hypothetical protein
MGKYDVSLSAARASVQRALRKLNKIRPRVTKADQKKIDLEIRDLKKAEQFIFVVCHIRKFKAAPSKRRK